MHDLRVALALMLFILGTQPASALDNNELVELRGAALLSCAYFHALSEVAYRFRPDEIRGVIVKLCRTQITEYSRIADTGYVERQRKKKEECGGSLCFDLMATDADLPNIVYAMILVDSVIKQYEDAIVVMKKLDNR
jgi:hypothetical protein